jgi:voltage-gated potassium channel
MKTPNESDRIVIHPNYEIFVFLITLLSIGNAIALLFMDSPQSREVIYIVDTCISVFLLADFFYRLYRSPDRWLYFTRFYGWLVFIGSLPIPILRLARLLATILAFRKYRRSDFQEAGRMVIENRAQSTLYFILLLAIVVLEISSVAVLNAEQAAANANIQTGSDALWWSYVTVTSVGYGDRYPVTNPGRIVGLFVMSVGLALFSVLAGFLADWFRQSKGRVGRRLPGSLGALPEDPRAKLQEIQTLIEAQEEAYLKAMADLKSRLAEIERSLG